MQFSFRFGWFFFLVFVWVFFLLFSFVDLLWFLYTYHFFFRFPIISSIVVILPVLINAWYKINWMKRKTTTTTTSTTERKKVLIDSLCTSLSVALIVVAFCPQVLSIASHKCTVHIARKNVSIVFSSVLLLLNVCNAYFSVVAALGASKTSECNGQTKKKPKPPAIFKRHTSIRPSVRSLFRYFVHRSGHFIRFISSRHIIMVINAKGWGFSFRTYFDVA